MGKRYKSTKKAKRKASIKSITLILVGLFLIGGAFVALKPKKQMQTPTPKANETSKHTLPNGMQSVIPSKANFPAPELSLRDLDGKDDSLGAYSDKVVLVNNWATWCPPCTAELPELEAYYREHKAEGFVIIGVEAGEPSNQVSTFIDQSDITYPIWLDPENKSIRAFRNNGLPNSVVIDRNGQVRLTWTGAISYDVLEEYVTPLINE